MKARSSASGFFYPCSPQLFRPAPPPCHCESCDPAFRHHRLWDASQGFLDPSVVRCAEQGKAAIPFYPLHPYICQKPYKKRNLYKKQKNLYATHWLSWICLPPLLQQNFWVCLKLFYICIAMKTELGKWLMDIAKYITTAVILTSIFADLNQRWVLYSGGVLAALITLGSGLVLVNDKNK